MPLDPQTRTIVERLNAIHFTLVRDMTPLQARRRERALRQFVATNKELEPVASVVDRHIPGPVGNIPLRIYTPQGNGPFPILVYFHSGGGVMGDLDSEDAHCRCLANLARTLVVSVDYRLAPEYKFPIGLEDCYAATCWVADHARSFNGDSSRIALGGISAGGNLAAVVAHLARDRGGPTLVFQLLLTPVTDFRLADSSSLKAYGEGYLLTKEDILWFIKQCFNAEEDLDSPLASPYLSTSFSRLPPALIITAEYDPLRDDGERYGARLLEAGIPVTISRRAGAVHGFLVSDQLQSVLAESATALRTAFSVR